MHKIAHVATGATASLVASVITPILPRAEEVEKELVEVKENIKAFKFVDHAKQNTWYHKTFSRPQKSRHTRTKRGRK